MLETGRILQDRYRVERQVGQGGMGSVYLASDERFHSTVAIKETLFGDEKYRKAFAREARLLNSLKHSALPKVSDHFIEDNGQYIVMEYIGGDDLFEMMRKSGMAFPVEEVLGWADQLFDALSYLHEQGIIHRDIKPQNLKLTRQKQIILLDFGLAKGNPSNANFQTAPQSIFGYSRNYASLEQIQGTGTDPRSDIYSLAATIYHLITGQVPADALTRVMMVLNENKDPLEPAGKFNKSISQEISDAVQTCLSLKAGSRPENVEEMRELFNTDRHTPFVSPDPENLTSAGRGDLHTQHTLVLDEPVSAGAAKPSELRTEVLGGPTGSDSIKTKLSNNPTSPISEVSKKTVWNKGIIGMATAGAAVFLIIGSIAAAVLFWPEGVNTSLPQDNSDVPNAVEALQDQGNANKTLLNGVDELTEEPGLQNVPSDPGGFPGAPEKQNPAASPAAVAKSGSGSQNKTPKNNAGADRENAVDEVTISNGTIRTKDAIMNDKGIIIRKSPAPVVSGDPRPTRERLKNLTPAQRLRLLQKIEAERRAAEQRRTDQQMPAPPPAPVPPMN